PTLAEEVEILERRRGRTEDHETLRAVTDAAEIQQMKMTIENVVVDEDVERYMVSLVQATRSAHQLAVGASPRASLALLKLSRIRAAMKARGFVVPDDVKDVVPDVLVHRLILKPDMWGTGHSARSVTESILSTVEVPKVGVS
ncbi:MAG TPA: MoxR family ATPase, partial [Spirochaetia bacterium]|nr:MoxR family ATPase [Spirochaetia bacterium]